VPLPALHHLQLLYRYHNTKFFYIAPNPASITASIGLSINQKLAVLPARNGAAFIDNIEPAWVTGNTLVIDFPYQSYPTNAGHWLEVILPAHRALQDGRWAECCTTGAGAGRRVIGAPDGLPALPLQGLFGAAYPETQCAVQTCGSLTCSAEVQHMKPALERPPHDVCNADRIVLLNLYKDTLTSWFKEMLKVALRGLLPPGQTAPAILDYGDLQKVPQLSWLGFENYIAVNDRCASQRFRFER
jgi:hypothetical protein